MDYDLVTLIPWVRRVAGDTAQSATFSTTSDGNARVIINNEGDIAITMLQVNYAEMTTSDYSLSGNVLTLNTPPNEGEDIFVQYRVTRYSDDDVKQYLIDAARGIAADCRLSLKIDAENFIVTDSTAQPYEGAVEKPEIDQLLVYRAAAFIYANKTNQTADDAIKIKDGDTSIDTSVTHTASEKRLAAIVKQYKDAAGGFLSSTFVGGVVSGVISR